MALLHHFSDRELPFITMSGVAFCLQIWPFFPGSCVLTALGPCFLASHLDCPLLTHNKIDSALVHVSQSQDTALVMRQKLNKAYIFPFADCDVLFHSAVLPFPGICARHCSYLSGGIDRNAIVLGT